MKTLIELYDSCQIENIVAGLHFLPEKIVFVGFKDTMKKDAPTAEVETFFESRGIKIETDFQVVGRYDYDSVTERLNRILDENEDCCFDLTGGKELVLAAMGNVAMQRNVPMIQINMRNGELVRVRNCDGIRDTEKPSMSIRETVVLNGGMVLDTPEDDRWEFTEDFIKDIGIMWDICRKNCGLWNRQSNVFESFEHFGSIGEELYVRVNLKYMEDRGRDVLLHKAVIEPLRESGLILNYTNENGILMFKYKNRDVHRCLTKAGNILELHAYLMAQEICREEPGYYDDIGIGVLVDWDGKIHDAQGSVRDTRNEIDILIMRGIVPAFISCKNGEVSKEALYEINAVAGKFGGKHAKKILLGTYISGDRDKKKYILQRAADMGITCIAGVETMNDDEFKQEFKGKIK